MLLNVITVKLMYVQSPLGIILIYRGGPISYTVQFLLNKSVGCCTFTYSCLQHGCNISCRFYYMIILKTIIRACNPIISYGTRFLYLRYSFSASHNQPQHSQPLVIPWLHKPHPLATTLLAYQAPTLTIGAAQKAFSLTKMTLDFADLNVGSSSVYVRVKLFCRNSRSV